MRKRDGTVTAGFGRRRVELGENHPFAIAIDGRAVVHGDGRVLMILLALLAVVALVVFLYFTVTVLGVLPEVIPSPSALVAHDGS